MVEKNEVNYKYNDKIIEECKPMSNNLLRDWHK